MMGYPIPRNSPRNIQAGNMYGYAPSYMGMLISLYVYITIMAKQGFGKEGVST